MSDWAKRNARALLKEFRRHGLATDVSLTDYRGEDLRGQVFTAEEPLSCADFSNADLTDVQFIGGVDLSDADLSGCRLIGARLDHANLSRACLTGANLDRASLIGVDLRDAIVDHATWRRARLVGAQTSDQVFDDTWGAAIPSQPLRLQMAVSGGVTDVSWHPHEPLLAVARRTTVEIWDPATGTQLTVLEGHTGGVQAVAWSPDGTRLASGSADRTVRMSTTMAHNRRTQIKQSILRFISRVRHIREEPQDSIIKIPQYETICSAFTPDLQAIAIGTSNPSISIIELGEDGPRLRVKLVGLPESGWASFWGDRHYQLHGVPEGRFWWSSGLCRFEAGEVEGLDIERISG